MIAGTLTEREQVQRWPQVRLDQFKRLEMMRIPIMDALNAICNLAMQRYDWQHRINSDYREGDTGQHGQGNAVDVVFYRKAPGDVDVWAQFDFAVSTKTVMRVGAYPHWNSPGIHIDMKQARLYWRRDEHGHDHCALNPADVRGLA